MKKLFTSFLAAGTVASFAACAKKEAKPAAKKTEKKSEKKSETKTTAVVKGKLAKGTFKIGYAGSNAEYTGILKNTLKLYTQDTVTKTDTGSEFFKLPSGLFLNSSDKFNSFVRESADYKTQITHLKTKLKKNMPFITTNNHGTHNRTAITGYGGVASLNDDYDATGELNAAHFILYRNNNTVPSQADFDNIFTDKVLGKIYENLPSATPTGTELYNAFIKAGVRVVKPANSNDIGYAIKDDIKKTGGGHWWVTTAEMGGKKDTAAVAFNLDKEGDAIAFNITNTSKNSGLFSSQATAFKADVEKSLDDKTKLASKNLDALFVYVTDGVENKSDVYKSVVEKKEFGTTRLFFIGEKAKSQEGASSKVFAGGNVSTASFNKYAAAYVAGFQAAVGAIKFSGSEDVYEETTVSFLIGSISESTEKKKAFAFRRGVEAAVAHPAYSKYLKVKFVSKVEDPSKASKKLYREISEWKQIEDSKSKLYHFSSSDTFSDADRRVVYIAGSTAKDWIGEFKQVPAADTVNKFIKGDDYGLVGALYNYKDAGTSATDADDLTTKTFSRGVWVVLDAATNKGATDVQRLEKDDLLQVKDGSTDTIEADLSFERHQVKFYGALGQESSGTSSYAEAALKGAYMGGPSYMIGKHTIFGAKLDISNVTGTKWSAEAGDKLEPWRRSTGSNDSDTKAEDRFNVSFAKATEKELTEAELTKSSPWLK